METHLLMNAAARSGQPTTVASPAAAWLDEMTMEITQCIVLEVFPSRRNDLRFYTAVKRSVRMHIVTVAAVYNGKATIEGSGPDSPDQCGAWLAECGFPKSTAQESYWVGMRRMLELWAKRDWFGLLRPGANGKQASTELIMLVTAISFDLAELGLRRAGAAYDQAAAKLRDSGLLQRRQLISDIVQERVPGRVSDFEVSLSYRLSGTHIGLLLEPCPAERVHQVIRKVQALSKARDSLLVMLDSHKWAAWLNYPHITHDTAETLCEAMADAGLQVSVGDPHVGLTGFRCTHLKAQKAEGLRHVLAEAKPHLVYRELALESVLLDNPTTAAAFASDELGTLIDHSPRAETIRETLFVWLLSGSRTATASELKVHENTVRQRLHFVAEELGPSFASRRSELLAALRICRAMGVDAIHAHT